LLGARARRGQCRALEHAQRIDRNVHHGIAERCALGYDASVGAASSRAACPGSGFMTRILVGR
jgi:hypothetical protein